jgi:hypothetical protein
MSDAANQMVLNAVKNRFAGVARYDVATSLVIETKPFLLGAINRVDFKRRDGSTKTVYAWAPELDRTGKPKGAFEFFTSLDELIPFVSRTPTGKSLRENFLSKLQPVDIVSGLIAIFMTFTMIFIIIHQIIAEKAVDVPLVLSNGITTILGFYFGRATTGQGVPSNAV